MATSGTVRPSSNSIYITWSLSSQSVSGNTSVINISFGWGFHSSPLDRQLDNGILKIGSTVLYQVTGRIKNYTGDTVDRDYPVWSGSRTISHDSAGNASFTLSGGMTGYSGDRSDGSGTWSLPQIPRFPTAPGTPSVSGHNDSDPTTATFSWSAPSGVGAGLTDRQLVVNTAADFAGVDEVNDTEGAWNTIYNATGLPKGAILYARVRAASSAGWGPWSGTLTFTIGTTAPTAPGTPSASDVAGSSLTVSWSAPSDSGGASISGYEVQRADNSSFTINLLSTSLPSVSTSFQVTGLTHTKTYYFRVRATNTAGATSNWSTTAGFTTTAVAPTAPAAPSISGNAPTALTISWSAPSDNGGDAVTGYEVQYSTSASFTSPQTLSASASPQTLGGLAPSTAYATRARAINSVGAGAWSASTTSRTTSGLRVPNAGATAWLEADVWVAVPVSGGYEWRRCLVRQP